MTGLAILLLFNLLGLLLHHYARIPIPENVLGMLLLLLALQLKLIKLEWVESAAGFLLHHMMLFFAPFIVAVLPLLPTLQSDLLPISAALLLSTFLTMLVTAHTAQFLSTREPTYAR